MLKRWFERRPRLLLILGFLACLLSFFGIYNYCSDGLVVGWKQPIVHDDLNFRVLNVVESPDPQGKRRCVVNLEVTSQAKRANFAADVAGIHCFDRHHRHLAAPSRAYPTNDPTAPLGKLSFSPGVSYLVSYEYVLPEDADDPRLRVSAVSGVLEFLDLVLEGRKQMRLREGKK